MCAPGLWEAQRSIAQPLLVMHGTQDPDFTVDHATGVIDQVQNGELWLVDGMAHSMPSELWPEMAARVAALSRASG